MMELCNSCLIIANVTRCVNATYYGIRMHVVRIDWRIIIW